MFGRQPGPVLVVAVVLVALVLVPGSMSATDGAVGSASAADAGDPLGIALSHVRATLRVPSQNRRS
jgi:hypothetical protein